MAKLTDLARLNISPERLAKAQAQLAAEDRATAKSIKRFFASIKPAEHSIRQLDESDPAKKRERLLRTWRVRQAPRRQA